ncbi:hypothetical protein FGSG_13126 [Fusarium graminearum PH-1]|uniref:Chromosome 4, complete genome n=1 Tax=Gibberella zeae (strain ATCC MYA-4620 / CBS 123657 / FGSC 9075 / NRRL 31084 / PH-1) TaxID=229533 RepID=I1S8E8_GIBZE|nr:hypothetical protein FGSG_13126 [Fusarium graminearum PH-1]ESU13588.1 hypothetical protein FGSG_13126 [Fusarium graminearum PH-1]CEF84465.1 unnamed protein product [Fusarium graminearum]|eukprot:XP_011327095.1 hypothetical protein FGSG_13126 [Fusarium graminearum PH-1]
MPRSESHHKLHECLRTSPQPLSTASKRSDCTGITPMIQSKEDLLIFGVPLSSMGKLFTTKRGRELSFSNQGWITTAESVDERKDRRKRCASAIEGINLGLDTASMPRLTSITTHHSHADDTEMTAWFAPVQIR